MVRGFLTNEPDKTAGLGSLGPSAIITTEASRPLTYLRLARRPPLSPDCDCMNRTRPKTSPCFFGISCPLECASARPQEAVTGMNSFFNRLTSAMSLVGLCALLLGGLGVRASVQSYLAQRRLDIAII